MDFQSLSHLFNKREAGSAGPIFAIIAGGMDSEGSIIPWLSNSDERTFLGICHSKKKIELIARLNEL